VSGAQGIWTQPQTQESQGVEILDQDQPRSQVCGLIPGNTYIFTWTLANDGCEEFSSSDLIVRISEATPLIADVGDDFSDCGNGSAEICAVPPTNGTGFWTSLNGSVDILSPDQPCSVVVGLQPGQFQFLWTVVDDVCNQFSSDTLIVTYEESSTANPDVVIVPFAGSITFDVTENDFIEGSYQVNLLSDPMHGSIVEEGNGEFTYTVDPTFAGSEELIYELCTDLCPDNCTQAKVILDVDKAECEVPTIITPNGDGVNDIFIIPCLATDEFPQNILSIFNQWGDEVFNASPYLNTWDGTYNGEDLPEGTYFYIIEFNNNVPSNSGFLVVKR
jgi:gliding motility-associated-like protein